MPESLLRDYSKTEAERREMVRQKFQACRESLAPAARAIFDRTIHEWYALTCEDEETRTKRRQQEQLEIRAACLREMRPNVREYYEREVGPAARNGNLRLGDQAYQPEFEAVDLKAKRVNELRRKTRQVFHMAIARGDLTNANRSIQNSIRIEQLERSAGDDMDELSHTFGPSVKQLPGNPGGRPLTENEQKSRKKTEGLSPADRMAGYEGLEAARRYMELGGNLADLVEECDPGGGGSRPR